MQTPMMTLEVALRGDARAASSLTMSSLSQSTRAPHRDRLSRHLRRLLGAAEHVDDLDPDLRRDVP